MTQPLTALGATSVPIQARSRPETPQADPSRADPAIRHSAEALEATFLAEMFKSAGLFRPTEALGGGGEGEQQFTSFLADERARAIVAQGGIGLADAIESSLRLRAGLTPQQGPEGTS
ncbi:rod-binding protein [Rhodobacter sp. NTK016B]|uniref:rod-binding protein n=1 Tax=Rhodobacter sp. NTK016B TaxID=2759676 RepID=UPI001A8E2E3B|nr:rod-binding protein [Rhodobacter sp. NTK016B]MBN8292323.1 rod-binding protein [Rhodobacter sp. NTK016B]